MELRESISIILRELRTQKSLTHKELSRKTGLSERYIIRLEKGKHAPGVDKIFKISEALNMDPSDLVARIYVKMHP